MGAKDVTTINIRIQGLEEQINTCNSRINALEQEIDREKTECRFLRKTIHVLGLALVDHEHQWTAEERELYESSMGQKMRWLPERQY